MITELKLGLKASFSEIPVTYSQFLLTHTREHSEFLLFTLLFVSVFLLYDSGIYAFHN